MTVDLLSTGIYDMASAERLVGMPSRKIRSWLCGKGLAGGAPVWRSQLADVGLGGYLSFLDLLELKVVRALREHGNSIATIRNFIAKVEKEHGTRYALTNFPGYPVEKKMYVVGKGAQAGSGGYDVDNGQGALDGILTQPTAKERKMIEQVSRELADVDYRENGRMAWKVFKDIIVIDPMREFGRPIIDRVSVPTVAVAKAMAAGTSRDAVKAGFNICDPELDAALSYEVSREPLRGAA